MPPGIPNAPLTVQNGGGAVIPVSTADVHAVIGVCTAGTANTLYQYTDPTTMQAAHLSGEAVEAAAVSLATPGTGSVILVPINASVAGTRGSVTRHVDGTVNSTFVLSGNPLESYDAIVKFLTGTTLLAGGTATFQYSLDNGQTFSPVFALSTSGVFAIPGTGLTFTIADAVSSPVATVVAGDYYTWSSVGPAYTSTDVLAAVNALLADPRGWNFLHLVGRAASGTATITMAGVLQTLMSSAEARVRYAFAMMEAAPDTDANLISAQAAFVGNRVMICADVEHVTSPLTGTQKLRSTAWKTAARIVSIPISQDPAAVEDGPLGSTGPSTGLIGRDEAVTPALNAVRYTTHRTFVGLIGIWVTNGLMMEQSGGDYDLVQYRRVMDRACEVAHTAAIFYLSKKVRVNGKAVKLPAIPGGIAEEDAIAIEKNINALLRDEIVTPGHASACSVALSRTANLISNGGVDPITIRLVKDGYLKSLPINIGFQNPALA
jgi:hypothetical protein